MTTKKYVMPQHSNIYFALKSVLYHEKHVLQLIHCVHAYSTCREHVLVSGMYFPSIRPSIEWIKLKAKFSLCFLFFHIIKNSIFRAPFPILS